MSASGFFIPELLVLNRAAVVSVCVLGYLDYSVYIRRECSNVSTSYVLLTFFLLTYIGLIPTQACCSISRRLDHSFILRSQCHRFVYELA